MATTFTDRVQGRSEAAVTEAPERTMTLAAEELAVSKRTTRTLVRASRTTSTWDKLVEVDLAHEQVEIERVPIGRIVEAVPPMRQEGDVTVMPVVEEELVVVRRLVLREEVRLRRVRTVTAHVQTVPVRRQDLTVTRNPIDDDELSTPERGADQPMINEGFIMNDETIVAVYDTAAHAEAAVAGLKQAGVPADAISMHSSNASGPATTTRDTGSTTVEGREQGFWASLFGGSPDYDTEVYDRSLQSGSTVVSVKTPDEHVNRVMEILESHNPIDIDDRAASYGLTQTTTDRQAVVTPNTTGTATAHTTGGVGMGAATGRTDVTADTRTGLHGHPGGHEEKIQLSEETLAVGKRVVNRGGTRIRRYVVETPVEEKVTLHDERVVLDRRPVTDGRTVNADFTDKTIEMTETAEEAVISKNARVVEEIGLRKEVSDRVETVRDTVRKEEVEVVQVPGDTTTTTTRTEPVTPRPKV